MTIKELKEIIKDLPDDMEVMIYDDEAGEYYDPENIGIVEVVSVQNRNGADTIIAMWKDIETAYKVTEAKHVLEIK